jgi:hypothetical protein
MNKLAIILAAATLGSITLETNATAGKLQKLSGAQIRAKFTGMQFTDEVHWRYVYDRGGRLRSYSMGTKKIGTWAVEKDELLYLKESDIMGSKSELLRTLVAASSAKTAGFGVPSSVPKWRAREDSNS